MVLLEWHEDRLLTRPGRVAHTWSAAGIAAQQTFTKSDRPAVMGRKQPLLSFCYRRIRLD